MTIPCTYGCRNDPCHIVLGSKFFYPLARIQFSIYLIHFTYITWAIAVTRTTFYWNPVTAILWNLNDIVISTILGLVLSMII